MRIIYWLLCLVFVLIVLTVVAAKFRQDATGKLEGEQRIRLLVGVGRGIRKTRLQYYLTPVGEVDLPAAE